MMRFLHRWIALPAAAVLVVVCLSGTVLSLFPLFGSGASSSLTVGEIASRVEAALPDATRIERSTTGEITAVSFGQNGLQQIAIDPATGASRGPVTTSAAYDWLMNLHRQLFAGTAGRIIVAVAAVALLALAVSGLMLAVRRSGGWRAFFRPARGKFAGRWHLRLGRLALPALIVSTLTALWMSASTFGLVPTDSAFPPFPVASGQPAQDPAQLVALEVPLNQLIQLDLPQPGDPNGAYTLTTYQGAGNVDPGTGQLSGWTPRTAWQRVMDWVHLIHTGQGASLLGLVLGLAALAVPMLAGTGTAVWLGGRGKRATGHAPETAGTVLLVASEGGTTWRFAEAAGRALEAATGAGVHIGPLSSLDPARYKAADRLLIFAATYGDGDAPEAARGALDRIAKGPKPEMPFAVLGFGDRGFPAFCAFAEAIRAAAQAAGWTELAPIGRVDRQSGADFHRWGLAFSEATGIELDLGQVVTGETPQELTLLSRRDHGDEVQAPVSILRFALPQRSAWQRLRERLGRHGFGGFVAGDLLGVTPQGDSTPRYYSLASGTQDGFVEIVVRRMPGGLCSTQLTALEPGEGVKGFVRGNPTFHPGTGKEPLILIGAGAGIGPLAGFARANRRRRPIHMYFGNRAKESDFLYEDELSAWQADGRLERLTTVFSRGKVRRHVQHALAEDAPRLADLISDGARVMVCGGREMANGVAQALADILAPLGLDPERLKAEGRYVEDVF